MSTTVGVNEYKKELESLCTRGGMREWPRKARDQYILLKSATYAIEPDREYSEKELNEILSHWCEKVGKNFLIDHATLRRFLVDAGFLKRDAAGYGYRLDEEPGDLMFERRVDSVDPVAVVQQANREIEERRRKYISGSG